MGTGEKKKNTRKNRRITRKSVRTERERDNFFYLFYKRKPGTDMDHADIDNQEIGKKLLLDIVS